MTGWAQRRVGGGCWCGCTSADAVPRGRLPVPARALPAGGHLCQCQPVPLSPGPAALAAQPSLPEGWLQPMVSGDAVSPCPACSRGHPTHFSLSPWLNPASVPSVCRDGVVTCEDTACPIACAWSAWSLWTLCDRSCGVGMQERFRCGSGEGT